MPSIPYTPVPGTLATLLCYDGDDYTTDNPRDYNESDLVEVEVIFDDKSLPCFYEIYDTCDGIRYEARYDIYTDGLLPIKIKEIHRVLPKGDSRAS